MPYLMVDLENMVDCEKGLRILRRKLGRGEGPSGGRAGCGPEGRHRPDARVEGSAAQQRLGPAENIASLPLPQKLKRIQSRGMWKHLVKIATSAPEPSSLPELDNLLDLPKNKMRSLKAIMAKLENRFGIQFLKVDHDAGVDAAGNPRYIMLPNVRRQILRLAAE